MDKPRTSISTPAAAAASAPGGRRDHHSTELGQEGALVQERTMAAMQILPSGHGASCGAPLTLSLRSNISTAGTLLVDDDEEPDSPTSPGSCSIPPDGYTPLVRTFSFGEYGPLPPPVNRELAAACYNAKSSCTASPSMDASFQPIQDDEPPISGDLGYDMYPPDYSVEPRFAVRQATEFAEIALRCHNDDPSNDVKYELVKATVSSYMFEGSGNYGHVNFTARAKQQDGYEGSCSSQS
ncbi:hypothetical protein GQ55_4G087000 [Panicum hallii var. hallii]|uniref:Uncharacterized protein n=1 Tax=Panicum hallii var. hallii TaxID=1504633 RepID=A0A2T7DWN1_9POAL|nr:hypothetical protein GQ55_4G087000 [Panicum hallii var. hallii]